LGRPIRRRRRPVRIGREQTDAANVKPCVEGAISVTVSGSGALVSSGDLSIQVREKPRMRTR